MALTVPSACRKPDTPPAAPEHAVFTAPSGIHLETWLYRAPGERPPGLLLLHDYNGSHVRWTPFAERAQSEGFSVVVADLPGHGAQAAAGKPSDTAWTELATALASLKDVLLRAGTDPENLAVLGEGFGANLALCIIERDPQYQAAVLVSPGLEYHGIVTEPIIRKLAERPVLLFAAENDAYAAASAETLKNAAPGFSEIELYPGTAHGTDLFTAAPDAENMALHWLGRTIGLKADAP